MEGENMTDITIKYDHGQMLIHLDNFLSDGKIAKVRKLLKLIRQSYTPECEEQIKEYIQCVVDEDKFNENQVALASKITNIESNIYILEKRLRAATLNRNVLKKSTPIRKNEDWEKWNERVNDCRESLKESKKLLTEVNREYKQNIKNMAFYKKVMQEFS